MTPLVTTITCSPVGNGGSCKNSKLPGRRGAMLYCRSGAGVPGAWGNVANRRVGGAVPGGGPAAPCRFGGGLAGGTGCGKSGGRWFGLTAAPGVGAWPVGLLGTTPEGGSGGGFGNPGGMVGS